MMLTPIMEMVGFRFISKALTPSRLRHPLYKDLTQRNRPMVARRFSDLAKDKI